MSYFCSECKTTITPEEYTYSLSKFGEALCREHQKTFKKIKKSEQPKTKSKTPLNENDGLSKKDSYYKESMIKGRIAETLIEELFLSLKFNVFRYGMENTVPGVMELLKEVHGEVADNIRRMPDFIIQDTKKKGEVYFVEVKFRKSEEFSLKDLPKDYPFENCYFILVSKKHIKCITYEELNEGKEITPKSKNYLGSRKEFDLDKDVIIDFCKFAIKFFENV
ncbi:MAG: hypothetical protein GQ477_00545 [Nanohaloarchaea archaeon]|nr:hypothetical protein [Candidatus Nanohaloarchaea archaeon]